MEMLDHALGYAERGWPVFRIAPGTKKPFPGSHGFKDAATNEILVTRMWDEQPDADIGMATGKTSGVWVLDIDGEEGSRNLTLLEGKFGPLPDTLESRTGSGGRHLFFKWPAAREVRNKQALLGHKGIDVRGEGGYVVLPPSGHPTGQVYAWPYEQDMPIAGVSELWIDAIAPVKRPLAPWEQPTPSSASAPPPKPVGSTPILQRAQAYLSECEPAVQGQGGHDKLLWAARALVVGFQIEEATAISLLWSDFNPRCSPQWDQSNPSERRDFERKVQQVNQTPGEKPPGWLLDEYGLRSGEIAVANIVGDRIANALLARYSSLDTDNTPDPDPEAISQRTAFPLHHFPHQMADYCRQVAEAHVVDPSFVGLPMLAIAGSAMGNCWRLKLKKNFVACPQLWIGLVAPSGSNKSGPLHEVLAALRKTIPTESLENPMLNPQGRTVVSDATLEAVIARLAENPRGLCVFRDELAGWLKSFNAYKKSGGDEQTWLEMWSAHPYTVDRKTNNEQLHIPAAAVSVVGGMQPRVLAECFDPARFASGLVPRILVTCPPEKDRHWTEAEVSDGAETAWADCIHWLRTRPFKGLDPNSNQFMPHILTMTPDAKAIYVGFFEAMQRVAKLSRNEHVKSFAIKAQVQSARMILIHRGMLLAETRPEKIDAPIGIESVRAGVEWMNWALAEQMRIYGFADTERRRTEAASLADSLRAKFNGTASVRQVQQSNGKKWKTAEAARESIQNVIDHGLARWVDPQKTVELI